ncbi:hypothetical protein J7E63_18045 [Bacillus sp. ISL-75]|uniref:hypothetical protein n=1 Tax=Bacillus sp. ISL-75 TaxID=2819137 RepID=UPI001BEBFD18|nr:hypothetical protein [Bacillus sp. ISL-75]MBT2728822.1 hypothetical protein [Bacillus sp. ISL-75]
MKFMVKAFDRDGQEIEFKNTIIGEKEVIFENEKAAEAFIEGIKNSLPSTFHYKVIPKEDEKDHFWSSPEKFW